MPAAATYVRDLRIVLRGRGFRRLFATRLASQLGDGVFQVGLAGLVFFSPERAATAGAAAAGFAVALLPYTVVGPSPACSSTAGAGARSCWSPTACAPCWCWRRRHWSPGMPSGRRSTCSSCCACR